MRCPDCGYTPGESDDPWCTWCEEPLVDTRTACLAWLGTALIGVGLWLLLLAWVRDLL